MRFPRKTVIFCAGVIIGTAATTTAIAANPNYSERFLAAVHLKLDEKMKDYSPKEFAKNKVLDKIRDCAVDWIMDKGDQHVHGPFTKGGGDEQATRQVVEEVIDPREWAKVPMAIVKIVLKSSHTASVAQDTPGASYDKSTHQWVDAPTDATPAPRDVTQPTTKSPAPESPQAADQTPNLDRPLMVPPINEQPSHSSDATRAADSRAASEGANTLAPAAQHSGSDGWPTTNRSDLAPVEHGNQIELRSGESTVSETHSQEGLKVGGEPMSTSGGNAEAAPSGESSGHSAPSPSPSPASPSREPQSVGPAGGGGGGHIMGDHTGVDHPSEVASHTG